MFSMCRENLLMPCLLTSVLLSIVVVHSQKEQPWKNMRQCCSTTASLRERYCYTVPYEENSKMLLRLNYTNALDWCQTYVPNSSLIVIPNEEIQNITEHFLSMERLHNETILTLARPTSNQWLWTGHKWANDQQSGNRKANVTYTNWKSGPPETGQGKPNCLCLLPACIPKDTSKSCDKYGSRKWQSCKCIDKFILVCQKVISQSDSNSLQNASDFLQCISDTPDRTQGGSNGWAFDMYYILGVVAFVTLFVVLTIVVVVLTRRKKEKENKGTTCPTTNKPNTDDAAPYLYGSVMRGRPNNQPAGDTVPEEKNIYAEIQVQSQSPSAVRESASHSGDLGEKDGKTSVYAELDLTSNCPNK